MKFSNSVITSLAAALLFSVSAFAADSNKGTLILPEKVTVEDKQLSPGRYTVQWDGSGPTVQVNITQGKETVATVSAKVVPEATNNPTNAYGSKTEADGTKSLTTIYLSGKKFNLEIGQSETTQQSKADSSK
jgi:hypothetical protein